jgi:adenine-specific DNA-methyltransferase
MATLLGEVPDHFKVLDAGAGVGSLSAAVCDRILDGPAPRQLEFHLYENDPALLGPLRDVMQNAQEVLHAAGHSLTYTIHERDFVLETARRGAQRMLFDAGEPDTFDAVIMNPPYFKIAADSPHARVMADAVRSQPNIYNLFMARAVEMLRPGGTLVAITPRSYCNGPYFREFRRWFFARMALKHVHLFESRRDTFDSILQESVITAAEHLTIHRPHVRVTTSYGKDLSDRPEAQDLPLATVLDDAAGEMLLRIPATPEDTQVLDAVEAWLHRFTDLGLRISTGPVVLFRAEQFLLSAPDGEPAAPLLQPHNVRPFQTLWPLAKRDKPTAFRVCPASLKHLVPTRNYTLLRRFSAKEERRRLTASCCLKSDWPGPHLALENHLNYVYHTDRELSPDEVYGLAALFNSALLDRYFRTISGNTQVNATEIRAMKFPDLAAVAAIGAKVRRLTDLRTDDVEHAVLDVLGVNGPLARRIAGATG